MVLYLQSTDSRDELYTAAKWNTEGEYLTNGDRFDTCTYIFRSKNKYACFLLHGLG